MFDGHGGDFVSDYANKNLHKVLAEQLKTNSGAAPHNKQQVEKSINESFDIVEKDLHQQIKQSSNIKMLTSGSCVLIALLLNQTLYVANSGDCEAILLKANGNITKLNRRHNIA